MRAERKAGQMLTDMAKRGERAKGGDPKSRPATLATLPDLGVTKTKSSRWQKLGDMVDQRFIPFVNFSASSRSEQTSGWTKVKGFSI
jgi:hypothetical protein